MTTNNTLFRFTIGVAEYDSKGYYVTRWDKAQSVDVVAYTRDEALEKVWTMLGKPTQYYTWAVRLDSTEEIANDNQ